MKVDGTQVLLLGIAWLTFMQKCASVEDIGKVFHKMPSWNDQLRHVKCRQSKRFGIISIMQHKDRQLNSIKFCGVLNACAIIVVLEEWGALMTIESGWDLDGYVWN
jgi:hypothetical protein